MDKNGQKWTKIVDRVVHEFSRVGTVLRAKQTREIRYSSGTCFTLAVRIINPTGPGLAGLAQLGQQQVMNCHILFTCWLLSFLSFLSFFFHALNQASSHRQLATSVIYTLLIMAVDEVDGQTSASVILDDDPKQAAAARSAAAQAALKFPDLTSSADQLLLLQDVAFKIPYTLKVVLHNHTPDSQQIPSSTRSQIQALLDSCFEQVNAIFNEYNPNSELSILNSTPVNQPHTCSKQLMDVIELALDLHKTTNGSFNLANRPMRDYWKQYLRKHKLPPPPIPRHHPSESDSEINALIRASTLDVFQFNDNTVTRLDPLASLDLGALSKGWTIDLVIESLNKAGYKDCFFDWGGDVRASGHNASNKPWAVGIYRPPAIQDLVQGSIEQHIPRSPQFDPEHMEFLRVVHLKDEAICTSGDYMQIQFTQNGDMYAHIFDSKNLSMLKITQRSIAQVSVISTSAMAADGIATAMMVVGGFTEIRQSLTKYRSYKHPVTDFSAYARSDERLSRMPQFSQESLELFQSRIALAKKAHVVVVGGGLAGVCAAIQASRCGASVTILEKQPSLGGNSAKATSGINAWGTRTQASYQVNDSDQLFERDTHLSALGGNSRIANVRMLSLKSADAIHWLMHEFDLPLHVLTQLGGHSRMRTHRLPPAPDGLPMPVGFTIMKHLVTHIATKCSDSIQIITNAEVRRILSTTTPLPEGGVYVKVHGIEFINLNNEKLVQLNADSIVMATGGYACDTALNGLLQSYAPGVKDLPTTCGSFTTGDGIKMGHAIGATLTDMDKIQLHPTAMIDPKDPSNLSKILGPEALRGSGGILLDQDGCRFVNELDLRSKVSAAIINHCNIYPSTSTHFAYCILNQESQTKFGLPLLRFYKNSMGLFKDCQDWNAVADLIGCPLHNILNTIQNYQKAKDIGIDRVTGKTVFPSSFTKDDKDLVVGFITPAIHYCMGGLKVNASAEVQMDIHSSENPAFGLVRPIEGLFAAGECTGGVHGENRLGGNSLLECVVFGKIAGDRAASIRQRNPTALNTTDWTPLILREIRDKEQIFGRGSEVFRFALPGSAQSSGLKLGQFISIRGEIDGENVVGFYSPITRPLDKGVISILARTDRGPLVPFLKSLKVGDAVEMKACGGLELDADEVSGMISYNGRHIRRFGLLAGGSGIAPMIQIIRACIRKPFSEHVDALNLIYAAETKEELTYYDLLNQLAKTNKQLQTYYTLSNTPQGWTQGVGYMDREMLTKRLMPPSDDLLVIICGPPIFQKVLMDTLSEMGYPKETVFSYL